MVYVSDKAKGLVYSYKHSIKDVDNKAGSKHCQEAEEELFDYIEKLETFKYIYLYS